MKQRETETKNEELFKTKLTQTINNNLSSCGTQSKDWLKLQ
jgi:hypothetical protein